MWIAFKNYYLRDTTQLRDLTVKGNNGCELLSKIIIFVTRHNQNNDYFVNIDVVNCFQKLLSSWHDTTGVKSEKQPNPLWIAFKNYYLRDTTQQFRQIYNTMNSCELLSKIIIFVTRHNFDWLIDVANVVVNCFQKLLSSWHDTTVSNNTQEGVTLWIAFKNYYLRDTTQLQQ